MAKTRDPAFRPLALRGVAGNVTYATTGPMAWYVLPGVRWSFRSMTSRDADVVTVAQRYAALAGRRLHLRVTSRPWSPAGWRAGMDSKAINPLPDWEKYLDAEAAHLAGRHLADKLVYLGVSLTRPAFGLGAWDQGRLAEEQATVDGVICGPGMDGRPCSQPELEYLLRRSIGLGCAPPADRPAIRGAWAEDDIAELARSVAIDGEPYGDWIRLTPIGGEARYVTTLCMGRTADQDTARPYLARVDKLGFGVETSVITYVTQTAKFAKLMSAALQRVGYQQKHYHEFDLIPPPALAQTQVKATAIGHELDRGLKGTTTRTFNWINWSFFATSLEELADRTRRLTDVMGHTVTVVRPADQYRLSGQQIPGETISTPAYRRTCKVTTLAGGVPARTNYVGHSTGLHVGHTSTGATRRPVLFDLHDSMERLNRPGLTLVAGQPGAGKSTLLGRIIHGAALSGVRTVALDPSGPMANLCRLPELAARSSHVDLMSARPGILNPFAVIPEPRREHFGDEAEPDRAWRQAMKMADASRRVLCADTLAMFLPAIYRDERSTHTTLAQACRHVGGHVLHSPRMVLNTLQKMGGVGLELYEVLNDISDLPAAQLVFPYEGQKAATFDDALLTVITMRGLATPEAGVDRKYWSQDEQFSIPLLHLAAWYTHRSVYQRDRNERKLVVTDETHALASVASGKMLLNTSARDSRKHNVRVILASQGVGEMLTAGIAHLVDSVFVGQIEDPDAQADALKVLKVPAGYEPVLGALSTASPDTKEMVYADGHGGVERITIDLGSLSPAVRAALDTTPTGMAPVAPKARAPRRRTKAAA